MPNWPRSVYRWISSCPEEGIVTTPITPLPTTPEPPPPSPLQTLPVFARYATTAPAKATP